MTRQEAMALREEINHAEGWQVEVRYDARGQDYYVAGVRRNDTRQWVFGGRADWLAEIEDPALPPVAPVRDNSLARDHKCAVCGEPGAFLCHGIGSDAGRPAAYLCQSCWQDYHAAKLEEIDAFEQYMPFGEQE
jgi:hypothetical protein